MRLLELILRQSNATELPRQPALQTSAVMEETSGNNMTQLAYGPLLGDTLLTECMPQLGNFLGGSDDCLSFDSITFENGHLAHPEGPLHGNASKEFNTETSSALATLLQSSHILTSGIRSSTSALSLVTATPGVQVASPGEVTTLSNRGDDAICVQCDRSSSTVASSREPSSGNDNGSRVTFTLDSVETMSVNIVNEPLSGSPTEGASSVNLHVQSIDDDLNVFHLADKEEIDITNFPLFNLDEALLENGIDAQDMSSLLEQFEASAEGNTSTELLDAAGLSPLPGSSSDNKMAALSMPRSASTTVLGEASGVVSRTHRKSMTDKILRSASEDCLRSIAPRAKTCNTNTLGKPSHVAKLCTSSAKHAKLAQKTADSHAKLPVHKSSSEVLLGQHRGTAAFKTGKRKHKSKQRLPNQTVSAPTSPAPSPRSSPSRDIIRKIKASSQKRKGAIMLTDPLPTRGCRSSRKPLKMPDMNPPSTRDYIITSSVETVPGSDSDGSLVSDTSSGLPTGGNLSDGQQRLSSTSKKISISLYRSRLQQRLQKQQEEGTAVEDGSSGRSSPCEVNMNYYDQILDHDYCQNVPLCNQEVPEVQNVPLCTDLASVLIVPRLSKFDIDAAMAACKKEKDNEMENSTPNNSAARLPPNGVVGVEPLTTSTSIASDVNGTILNNQPSKEGHPSKKMYPDATKVEIKAVATENTSTRSRRETITDVVDMDIDSDNGGSHGDDAVKRGAVSKPSVVVDTEMADGNKNDSDSVAKPSHKSRPEMLVSIAEKEVEYSSPEGSTGEVLAPQKHVGDTVGLPETCSNASTEVGKEVNRFSRFDSEKQETSTPAKGQILNDRGNTGFKPHSGRSRNQNYRRNNRSPYHKDDEYYDKVPNYFTALSVQSQITQPIKRVHSGLQLVDESLPGHDRDPSPNRNDPVYDKLPAYYSCFTNSVRYDNNNHDDPLAANGGDSASNSGYSSRSSSVSTDTRGSSRGRSLSISSSWSCSSRSCSRERQPYRSSRSSWQRQRSRVHRRRSYSSSSRSLSRSRSSRSRSPLSRSSRSYSRRRSYSRHSRSRSRRSWSRRSRSRHRHTRGHSSRQRKRSRSSSDELISSQRADAQMRQIEERRIVYVGRIPTDYTKSDLRRRFGRFGVIEDVSVHFREHGDNYGFVTFEYTCDAFAAKENGNKVPGCETFDLCFGGRRHFCRSNYADLDGNMEDEEEMCGVMPKQVTADLDFDALLRQATKKLKNKQRKL